MYATLLALCVQLVPFHSLILWIVLVASRLRLGLHWLQRSGQSRCTSKHRVRFCMIRDRYILQYRPSQQWYQQMHNDVLNLFIYTANFLHVSVNHMAIFRDITYKAKIFI
jgi:hypothetical protein